MKLHGRFEDNTHCCRTHRFALVLELDICALNCLQKVKSTSVQRLRHTPQLVRTYSALTTRRVLCNVCVKHGGVMDSSDNRSDRLLVLRGKLCIHLGVSIHKFVVNPISGKARQIAERCLQKMVGGDFRMRNRKVSYAKPREGFLGGRMLPSKHLHCTVRAVTEHLLVLIAVFGRFEASFGVALLPAVGRDFLDTIEKRRSNVLYNCAKPRRNKLAVVSEHSAQLVVRDETNGLHLICFKVDGGDFFVSQDCVKEPVDFHLAVLGIRDRRVRELAKSMQTLDQVGHLDTKLVLESDWHPFLQSLVQLARVTANAQAKHERERVLRLGALLQELAAFLVKEKQAERAVEPARPRVAFRELPEASHLVVLAHQNARLPAHVALRADVHLASTTHHCSLCSPCDLACVATSAEKGKS
mmetsp:Transcript_21911/g.38792  ORF Transcript_21911/g.38792 Transcript_21911/m.38792 type:complete len:414 (-) Transcript_21911:191-1432(-)